jgi:hypothetical protein
MDSKYMKSMQDVKKIYLKSKIIIKGCDNKTSNQIKNQFDMVEKYNFLNKPKK